MIILGGTIHGEDSEQLHMENFLSAIYSRNERKVENLLFHPLHPDKYGNTLFDQCLNYHLLSVDSLKFFMKHGGWRYLNTPKHGETPLHLVANMTSFYIESLIEMGAHSFDHQDSKGRTPFDIRFRVWEINRGTEILAAGSSNLEYHRLVGLNEDDVRSIRFSIYFRRSLTAWLLFWVR